MFILLNVLFDVKITFKLLICVYCLKNVYLLSDKTTKRILSNAGNILYNDWFRKWIIVLFSNSFHYSNLKNSGKVSHEKS